MIFTEADSGMVMSNMFYYIGPYNIRPFLSSNLQFTSFCKITIWTQWSKLLKNCRNRNTFKFPKPFSISAYGSFLRRKKTFFILFYSILNKVFIESFLVSNKRFARLNTGPSVIKNFTAVIYEFSY